VNGLTNVVMTWMSKNDHAPRACYISAKQESICLETQGCVIKAMMSLRHFYHAISDTLDADTLILQVPLIYQLDFVEGRN